MKKVIVGVPVFISCEQHLIFTNQAIASCKDYDVLAFLNRVDAIPDGKYKTINIPTEVSVSAAWNILIKESLKQAEYVLIINNDIIFHPQAIENLIKFADSHSEFIMWTAAEWPELRTINDIPAEELAEDRFDEYPHLSAFMVNKKTIEAIGDKNGNIFDENLERAYFEDMQAHHKILKLGYKAAKTASARFYHFGSRTIKCDDELNRQNAITYERNRAYLQKKTGVDPHGKTAEDLVKEGFEYPFNDKTRSWKDA